MNHDVEQTVSLGEEKGYFEFGGSTVIVAVQAGQVRIDEDICKIVQKVLRRLLNREKRLEPV